MLYGKAKKKKQAGGDSREWSGEGKITPHWLASLALFCFFALVGSLFLDGANSHNLSTIQEIPGYRSNLPVSRKGHHFYFGQ